MAKFRTTVYIGTVNGKKIRKAVSADSKQELDLKVKRIKKQYKNGFSSRQKNTFGLWAAKWWYDKQIEFKYTKAMSSAFKRSIAVLNTRYENVLLSDIKASDFQNFLIFVSQNSFIFLPNGEYTTVPREKICSKSYLSKFINVAAKIFKYAIANDVPCTYFFDAIDLPFGVEDHHRRALSFEEIKMITDTTHKVQPAAMVMLFAGLRRAEMLALTFDDIDFEKNLIHVRKTLNIETNEIQEHGKTINAIRSVPMPPILRDYLKTYKELHKTQKWIVEHNGKYYTASGFRSLWKSYLNDLNVKYGHKNKKSKHDPAGIEMLIEKVTPHFLRHTYATMLFLTEVDQRNAMQYLGHSDIQTTINIYTDLKYSRHTISDEYMKFLEEHFKFE